MNVPEAVEEIQKLSNLMTACAERAQTASVRYEAHMSLYNAASMSGDMPEMETQRLTIHSQVDAILDAGFELHNHRRRIMEIQRTVS